MAKRSVKPRSIVLNKKHPLAKKLVIDFPLFERGGTSVRDFGQRHRTASFAGAPTWVVGELGIGVHFDGAADAITITTSPDLTNQSDNWSLECWFNADSLPSAPSEPIPFQLSNNNDNAGVSISLENQTFKLLINGITRNSTSVAASTGTLYHVVIRRLNGSSTLYINGKDSGPNDVANVNMPASTLTIGAGRQNSSTLFRFFNGTVYIARYWERALTASDVKQLYVNPWCLYQKPVFITIGKAATSVAVISNRIIQLRQAVNRANTY